MKAKEFFAKKSAGFYATVLAVILGIVAVSVFSASRESDGETAIIWLLVAAIVCSAFVAVIHIPLTEYVPLALYAIAAALVLILFLNNMADIFAKNNVLGLSTEFVVSMVFCVLAMVSSCVSVICGHEKK